VFLYRQALIGIQQLLSLEGTGLLAPFSLKALRVLVKAIESFMQLGKSFTHTAKAF
jgi:hypothetical protein